VHSFRHRAYKRPAGGDHEEGGRDERAGRKPRGREAHQPIEKNRHARRRALGWNCSTPVLLFKITRPAVLEGIQCIKWCAERRVGARR
jgi:hypothetical protein